MHYIASLLALAAVAAAQQMSASGSVSVTPHEQYSSSIGVLGCMVNTNRIAYWPYVPDCNNMCVNVTANGRTVTLLHVDRSGGAFDISYDAYNQLVTGESATTEPIYGTGVSATYEYVPMSECQQYIHTPDGKLPFIAASSMNFIGSCLAQNNSWVATNFGLWNIADAGCCYGLDEECTLDLKVSNQPACPHQLGINTPLPGMAVVNIQYGTGKQVPATT